MENFNLSKNRVFIVLVLFLFSCTVSHCVSQLPLTTAPSVRQLPLTAKPNASQSPLTTAPSSSKLPLPTAPSVSQFLLTTVPSVSQLNLTAAIKARQVRFNSKYSARKKSLTSGSSVRDVPKNKATNNSQKLLPAAASVRQALLPTEASVSDAMLHTEASVSDGLLPTEASVSGAMLPTEGSVSDDMLPTEASVSDSLLPTEASVIDAMLPTEGSVSDDMLPTEASVSDAMLPTEGSVRDDMLPAALRVTQVRLPAETSDSDALLPAETRVSQTALTANVSQRSRPGAKRVSKSLLTAATSVRPEHIPAGRDKRTLSVLTRGIANLFGFNPQPAANLVDQPSDIRAENFGPPLTYPPLIFDTTRRPRTTTTTTPMTTTPRTTTTEEPDESDELTYHASYVDSVASASTTTTPYPTRFPARRPASLTEQVVQDPKKHVVLIGIPVSLHSLEEFRRERDEDGDGSKETEKDSKRLTQTANIYKAFNALLMNAQSANLKKEADKNLEEFMSENNMNTESLVDNYEQYRLRVSGKLKSSQTKSLNKPTKPPSIEYVNIVPNGETKIKKGRQEKVKVNEKAKAKENDKKKKIKEKEPEDAGKVENEYATEIDPETGRLKDSDMKLKQAKNRLPFRWMFNGPVANYNAKPNIPTPSRSHPKLPDYQGQQPVYSPLVSPPHYHQHGAHYDHDHGGIPSDGATGYVYHHPHPHMVPVPQQEEDDYWKKDYESEHKTFMSELLGQTPSSEYDSNHNAYDNHFGGHMGSHYPISNSPIKVPPTDLLYNFFFNRNSELPKSVTKSTTKSKVNVQDVNTEHLSKNHSSFVKNVKQEKGRLSRTKFENPKDYSHSFQSPVLLSSQPNLLKINFQQESDKSAHTLPIYDYAFDSSRNVPVSYKQGIVRGNRQDNSAVEIFRTKLPGRHPNLEVYSVKAQWPDTVNKGGRHFKKK